VLRCYGFHGFTVLTVITVITVSTVSTDFDENLLKSIEIRRNPSKSFENPSKSMAEAWLWHG